MVEGAMQDRSRLDDARERKMHKTALFIQQDTSVDDSIYTAHALSKYRNRVNVLTAEIGHVIESSWLETAKIWT